ncbi:MAG TPA: hypothetical protein VK427_22830 [Kofleriaceae bacterium]|nr:hypothetical protein [Kofleriaceae bacterium]
MSSLRPTAGARFLLELERVEPGEVERAVYRATVFTVDAEFTSTVTLAADGAVLVASTGADKGAPGELADTLVMLARLIARGAAKRRDDGLPAWPQRLLRWRGPGRGE